MRVLGQYGAVLATPGGPSLSAAGLVARLPSAMSGIALLVLVQDATGSYATAGGVAGAYGVCVALASPALARAVDRRGQRPVLLLSAALQAVGLLGLVVLARAAAPPALYAAAALAGTATVSVGSLVRARWSHLLRGSPLLGPAYALESILDEGTFVVAPVLVTVLATAVAPAAGVVLAVALLLAGVAWLAAQVGTAPPVAERRADARDRALVSSALVLVCVVLFLAAGVFGSVEVFVLAEAQRQGAAGATGPLLAAFAGGSLVGGLVYGAVAWRSSLRRRFPLTVAALAAGVALLPLSRSLLSLGLLLALSGAAIAPMLITGFTLVQGVVPASRLTEGLTWATLSLNLSYAGSTALAGVVVGAAGARAGTVVPVASGVAALLVAVAGARVLPDPPARVKG